MRRRMGFAACAVLIALIWTTAPAEAQRPEPEHGVIGHTMMAGTGFIATPYAQVRPGLFGTAVAIFPSDFQPRSDLAPESYTVLRASVGLGLSDWIEAGVTIHGTAVGAFGKVQVIRQQGFFPGIAGGVQNLVSDGRGRFGIEDPFYDNLKDAATIYGVATYIIGPGGTKIPSWVILSAGFGTGLFSEDNPAIEEDIDLRGVFAAAAFDFMLEEDVFLRFMFEYDGFDINIGAMGWVKGLEVSAGVLSANRNDPPDPPDPLQVVSPTQSFQGSFYNQLKPYVMIGIDIGSIGGFPWIFKKKPATEQ